MIGDAHGIRPLPALDELAYRIDQHARASRSTSRSGDEAAVVTFLREDVEPLFEQLAGFGAAVRDRIEAYRGALDPRCGTVYRRGKCSRTA